MGSLRVERCSRAVWPASRHVPNRTSMPGRILGHTSTVDRQPAGPRSSPWVSSTRSRPKRSKALKQGQDKLDEVQAKKKADGLLRSLGAWHYAVDTGRDDGNGPAEIARITAELQAHEAENGPLGGADRRHPGPAGAGPAAPAGPHAASAAGPRLRAATPATGRPAAAGIRAPASARSRPAAPAGDRAAAATQHRAAPAAAHQRRGRAATPAPSF